MYNRRCTYREVYPRWCIPGCERAQRGEEGCSREQPFTRFTVGGQFLLPCYHPFHCWRTVPAPTRLPRDSPLPVSLLADSCSMLGTALPGGICRVPPSCYMPPSRLLVGIPASHPAGRCQRVHTSEHELACGDNTYSRVVEEERPLSGEKDPFSPQEITLLSGETAS